MLNVSIQPDKRSCCIPAVGFRLVSAQYTRILQQSHNVPDFSFACRRLFLAESPYHRFLNMAANLTGTIYEMKIRKEKNFNRSWKAVLRFQWCWFTEAKGLAAVLRDIWFLNRFIWSFPPFVSLCHCFHTHSGWHGCVLQACCIAGLPPDLRQTMSLT